MTKLRFRYTDLVASRPVWTLAGRLTRPRPLLLVTVIGPTGSDAKECLLDTGADDTVFPLSLAATLGLDLGQCPTATASGVGPAVGTLYYAEVKLRLTDGTGFCEWPARVGFTSVPLKRALLGFAGCLQFFRAHFDGESEVVELTTNGLYPGT